MGEANNMYPNLSSNTYDDQQFRLNKINEIRDYFVDKKKKENQ